MSVILRRGLLMVMTALVPATADACCFLNPFDTCGVCRPRPWIGFTLALPLPCLCGGGRGLCNSCLPPAPYGCGPALCPPAPCGPAIAPPVTPPSEVGPSLSSLRPSACRCAVPPVCTTLQPRQVTMYRDVPTIQYRREAYIENVPVTTYQQVIVPRTVYQPQTRYRDVAYTVNRRVAQTRIQCVPQRRIGRVPLPPFVSAPCTTCNPSAPLGLSPQFTTPSHPSTTATLPATPSISARPYFETTTSAVPTPRALPPTSAATLQPPQPSVEAAWQTIPQRQAQASSGAVQQMSGYMPSDSPSLQSPTRSLFQPAPTAASVWQSRWMR